MVSQKEWQFRLSITVSKKWYGCKW